MKLTEFCNIGAGISLIFIIGMVYFHYIFDKNEATANFTSVLSEKQVQKYKEITNERLNIYYRGYLLGLFISLCVIILNVVYINKKLGKIQMACITGGITFLTTYFSYILSNKSDYMLLHIRGDEQKSAWLKLYKTMQYNYHMGLVFGIIAAMSLGYGFC